MGYQWTLTMHEWVICSLSMGLNEHSQIIDGFKVGIKTAWMGRQLAPIEHGCVISWY